MFIWMSPLIISLIYILPGLLQQLHWILLAQNKNQQSSILQYRLNLFVFSNTGKISYTLFFHVRNPLD